MRSFKDTSIKTKLSLLLTVAGGVAVLLSCGALAVNDYLMIRDSKVRQLATLTEMLASQSTAALIFDDPITATELLDTLRGQPTVCYACLYNAEGEAFATFDNGESRHDAPPPIGPSGFVFAEHGELEVTQAIVQDGTHLGTIVLHASAADLHQQLYDNVRIVGTVMLVSLCGLVLLSGRLQRVISVPLLRLARAAQKISAEGDYTIRVQKEADDELGTLTVEFNLMLRRIQQSEEQLQRAHDGLELRVEQRTAELSRANLDLSREIAERQRTENELDRTHRQLVDAARQAGMAEIATGVLHNVGNVLNSVNVSATLVGDRLRSSKLGDLRRAVELMSEHADALGRFITEDAKGKLLPNFLAMLAEHLDAERRVMLEELDALADNIDHVKTIVAMQQSYAGVAGVEESVALNELIEDALKMNASSLTKYGIEVVRQFDPLPRVAVEKQKLLQILVNLIANAKDALIETIGRRRRLTLGVSLDAADRVQIEVTDRGVGIPPDDLARIFSHGFTTKRHGHGFGLHTSANAAKEMGGRLTAHSDGPNRGATFVVDLPYKPAEAPARMAIHSTNPAPCEPDSTRSPGAAASSEDQAEPQLRSSL